MNNTERILIIDLEATCWQGPAPENQSSEILEIGATIYNAISREIEDNFCFLIKPIHSEISPFCAQLTTISSDIIEKQGIDFADACETLRIKHQSKTMSWASYGAYDFKMIQRQCGARNIENPFSQNHINVKELFSEKCNGGRKVGMNGALSILKIPLEGTHHRGIDDSKNIAKILDYLLNI